MTSNTTVDRTGTVHPRLLAGSIGVVAVAIGLAIGIAVGAGLLAPTKLADAERGAPPNAQTDTALPVSAPGNPYVNIHVAPRQPIAPALPTSAPGNPYVNIHVPTRGSGD